MEDKRATRRNRLPPPFFHQQAAITSLRAVSRCVSFQAGGRRRRRAKPSSPYARRLIEVKIRERRADSLGAMVLRTRAHRRRIRRAPYDGHLCPGAFQEHPWPARFRSQKSAELLG